MKDKTDQIIKASISVFAKKGYLATTTKEIANKANKKIKIPTTLILSSDDKIIDNHPTREFFEQTCTDLHVTELTGAHMLGDLPRG